MPLTAMGLPLPTFLAPLPVNTALWLKPSSSPLMMPLVLEVTTATVPPS